MSRPVREQVVVVTGASSGIGRCTAQYLAARGARLVLTARRAEALENLAQQLEALGGKVVAVPGDVTRKADLREVAHSAVERFGRIDTWVNNAGIYLQGRVLDIDLAEYRRVLDVNVVGMINGTQCALEIMLPARNGTIVQVSSVAAKRGVPWTTAYSASKAALDGFTSALRAELWGSGVRLSILYPPTVDTPIYHQARGKLGVIPKPAPPVADPIQAARAIARLAETGGRYRYFGWAGPLRLLDLASPGAGDWLLHHFAPFTVSTMPSGDDNLDRPIATIEATARAGWSKVGWKGLTLREAARSMPYDVLLAGAALGFVAGRAFGHWRNA